MWLWPPQDVFFLRPPLFQADPMAMTWFLITVIVFPHLTLRWSHQLSSFLSLNSFFSYSLFLPPHPSPGLSLYSFSDDDDVGNECNEASCGPMVQLSHQMKARFSRPSLTSSCLHFRDDVTDEQSTGPHLYYRKSNLSLFMPSRLFMLRLLLCVVLCLLLFSLGWNEHT